MTSSRLKVQHTSLQFSDSKEQQKADVRQLFKSARDYPIKTGTEGGPETHSFDYLHYIGKEFNHAVHVVRGNWIAIDRRIIRRDSLKKDQVFVVRNDKVVGKMHDRVLATVEFDHQDPRMGHIGVSCAHYPTKGREKSDPNNDINELYAEKIAGWMKDTARGNAIAFTHGDFNMVDSAPRQDWSFGENWTSMADELKAWENTGHGPIDGFASYDLDGRVKAKKFDVFQDNRVKMHSDHFVVRGEWEVGHIRLDQ